MHKRSSSAVNPGKGTAFAIGGAEAQAFPALAPSPAPRGVWASPAVAEWIQFGVSAEEARAGQFRLDNSRRRLACPTSARGPAASGRRPACPGDPGTRAEV